MEPQKAIYSWQYYHTLVNELIRQIKPTPNIVVGIGKGGLIPGVILAEKYECTLLNLGLRSYDGYTNGTMTEYQSLGSFDALKEANVLIVDDIADTGNTFKYATDLFAKQQCESVQTAAVFYKSKSSFKPTYYAHNAPNDVWIVQPWEVLE